MNQTSTATTPGIVVLSSSLQLLHINQQAVRLLTALRRRSSQLGADRNLIAPLQPLAQDISGAIWERLTADRLELFHCSHAIGHGEYKISLNGFGLPDTRGLPYSRIVLLLSPEVPPTRMPCPDERGAVSVCAL